MTAPLRICVVTDGKPGHQNQSLGLAEAIQRTTPTDISVFKLPAGKIRPLGILETPSPKPDLFIGAGHTTHAPLLQFARRTGSPCVVLMKPSLPSPLFDLCLIPEHDLGHRPTPPNVFPTKGALNRVPPPDPGRSRESGLILIGGPSGSHGWDGERIAECVAAIVKSRIDLPWKLTDSRRTPPGDLEKLSEWVTCHPHAETGPDWLPRELGAAREVWVTEDSVSMIYEALSSGASVGLLPVPRRQKSSRLSRGVDGLVTSGRLIRFEDWIPGDPLPKSQNPLREADRAASMVLQHLFPHRL